MTTFDSARYCSLATFRRDGREVATPVWFAGHRGVYYVFSAGDAGKVKRLRVSSRARVAACDVRGRFEGPWQEAEAVLLDHATDQRKALAALRDKYGWQMTVTDLLAKLTGRFGKRAYIRVETNARAE